MHSAVAAALVVVVAGALHAEPARAAATIPPEVKKFRLASCTAGPDAPPCIWDCSAERSCCADGCETGGCDYDAVDAVSTRIVLRVTDCPTGGGATMEVALRGTSRSGTAFVVPSRTVDLCTANVQCGAFRGCAACTEPECPPLCADPVTTCPPPLPGASSLCENPGQGPDDPLGRPEVCRDPPGSDRLPTGRRFCEADFSDPVRYDRWLRLQPLLPAIRDDLAAAIQTTAAGPAVVLSVHPRADDPSPGRGCGLGDDAAPCCEVRDLPEGGIEASCCVTVALLRQPKPVPVPADLAAAPIGRGSLALGANPCGPLCGNGEIDPGETCEPAQDAACPGQCLPAGHREACRCNRPPRCEHATAEPALLWPPNGKLVPVAVKGVDDPDGDPVAVTVTGIAQDEHPTGARSGPACANGRITDDGSALLRAERRPGGDGRVYRVAFVADDGHGRQCAGSVTACVPHDRSPQAACGDQGPRFDSIACSG